MIKEITQEFLHLFDELSSIIKSDTLWNIKYNLIFSCGLYTRLNSLYPGTFPINNLKPGNVDWHDWHESACKTFYEQASNVAIGLRKINFEKKNVSDT